MTSRKGSGVMRVVKEEKMKKKQEIVSEESEEEEMDYEESDEEDDSEEAVTEEGSEEDDEDDEDEDEEDEDEDDSEEDSDSGFEVQSSDDEEDSQAAPAENTDEEDEEEAADEQKLRQLEARRRFWDIGVGREKNLEADKASGDLAVAQFLHADDLSSDDEVDADSNTIGRVPLHWYDAFDHIGYNRSGQKIAKKTGKDRLDLAIQARDDPNAMRKVYDMYNDREVEISERELEIIRRIQAGAFAHPEFNDTPDYVDYFSSQVEVMPLSARPEPKSAFVPSKWEMVKVRKIMQAMKEGRYKTRAEEKKSKKKDGEGVFLIWNDADDEVLAESKRNKFHLPAPKMPLPGHAESYNPPEEYLWTEEEKAKYEAMDPEDRPLNFIPKKHTCLRHVGAYDNLVRERFERCMDLYLAPRKLKKRLNIDPEALMPKLPNPRELKPFPNTLALQFLGHKGAVHSISVSPDGQYLVSGSEDGSVRLWEVDTCLCKYVWHLKKGPVTHVAFNPDPNQSIVLAVAGKSVVFITTGTGDVDGLEMTESQLAAALELAGQDESTQQAQQEEVDEDAGEGIVEDDSAKEKTTKLKTVWHLRTDNVKRRGVSVGPRVELLFESPITKANWHSKGDYVVVVCPDAQSASVSVHQLSKARTQFPFSKNPGLVQSAFFHPSLPCLILVTQQHVKLYHLVEQKLVKKLLSGCKWLSSADIHPSGDHIIVGSYDRRVVWFDLDLSSTPYKTLKFHEKAVRAVTYHKRYPLFASAADDGSVHIFHSTVYSDLMKNPMIVPLKVLRGHGVVGDVGVLSTVFHPRQPWVFTAGADGLINLYQDI